MDSGKRLILERIIYIPVNIWIVKYIVCWKRIFAGNRKSTKKRTIEVQEVETLIKEFGNGRVGVVLYSLYC